MEMTSNRLQTAQPKTKNWLPYFIALFATAIAIKTFWGHLFPANQPLEVLLLGLPLWLVIAFNGIPLLIQHRYTRLLSARGRSGELPQPGYFRLRPYDDSKRDRAAYERHDNEHKKVLKWLFKSEEVVHYLTGRSGTGKSSLLNAFVLPMLQESPHFWRVIKVHTGANPIENLFEALKNHPELSEDYRDDGDMQGDLEYAIHKACQKSNLPLLIVWDQFEEFLIQNEIDSPERKTFENFIKELAQSESKNLRIMLVFRTDYLHPLIDGGLPPLATDRNWEEVSPFSDEHSRTFLRQSNIDISEKLLDHIMHVIFEIEETKGLVRPITLNMIGLVLKHSNKSERAHLDYKHSIISLMDSFLRKNMSKPILRAHIETLLRNMLTADGTKKEVHIEALAKACGKTPAVINGCLIELGQHGLVRRRDRNGDLWEVSHDFVAKQLDLILRKWKPPFFHRFRTQVFYSLSLLWALLLFGLFPAMQNVIENYTISSLVEMGGEVSDSETGKKIRFRKHPRLDRSIPLMQRLESFTTLDLQETLVTDLSPISQLSSLKTLILAKTPYLDLATLKHNSLESLNLSDTGIESLDGILKLKSLVKLDLSGSKVEHVTDLKALPNLTHLDLNRMPVRSMRRQQVNHNFAEMSLTELMHVKVSPENVPYLTELKIMPQLEWLSLADTEIDVLDPLAVLHNLQGLDITRTQIEDLSPLVVHRNLNWLSLSETYLEDISAVSDLVNLKYLDLSSTKVSDLGALQKLVKLEYLNLNRSDARDLDVLGAMTNLKILKVNYTYVADLQVLAKLTKLERLELQGTSVKNLDLLPALPKLKALNLADTAIKDIAPLKKLQNLEELDLSSNRNEDPAVLFELPALKTLYLRDAQVSRDVIERLRSRRPNLAIILD